MKPVYVIIIGDKIYSEEEMNTIDPNTIKGMVKGVTDEERDKLAKKFGDRIGDKEFVIKIELLTEQEKADRKNQQASAPTTETQAANPEDDLKLKLRDAAAEFTVEMIDGQQIRLSGLKGKVVLLNYWATWCSPCLMEFAEIPEKILEKYKGQDFVFLPISIGEPKEKVQQKMVEMKKYGVHFNAGIDPDQKIWNNYAKGPIPKNFLIDQNGVIQYISVGNSEGNVDKLATEIGKLLGK